MAMTSSRPAAASSMRVRKLTSSSRMRPARARRSRSGGVSIMLTSAMGDDAALHGTRAWNVDGTSTPAGVTIIELIVR
jgi:hypothetical protein